MLGLTLTAVVVFSGLVHGFLQKRLDNGLAYTPPMGWDSYNHYSCQPNASIIESNAKALVDFGLADLGYDYAITDCGWTVPYRTANGTLTWNATLFPDGFPALGEYIHSLGLGFGVYSDAGIQMCHISTNSNQTGSLFFETTDADTFAAWGADLLKYDNCYSDAAAGYPDADYTPNVSPLMRYDIMKSALNNTGRPIIYQICEWGVDFPSGWAGPVGDSWRITNDIIPDWRTVYRQVNQAVPSTPFAGPEHWPDLDMLEVGNDVFTFPEEQTHFSLWAIMKSPLVIGAALNDTLTTINPTSLAILKNTDAISYNQDSLGVSATLTRRYTEAGLDTWAGPLSNNRTVVAFVNWNDYTVNATLDLPDIGLQSAGHAIDVWNNKTLTSILTSYQTTIAAHGTLLLELSATVPANHYPAALFGTKDGNSTTFTSIYGLTSSAGYTLTVTLANSTTDASTVTLSTNHRTSTHHLPATVSEISIPLSLLASASNTITLSHPSTLSIASLTIAPPNGTFYAAPLFSVSGTADHVNCTTGLCSPVGAKLGYLSPTGYGSLNISSTINSSDTEISTGAKYAEIYYINNDIAFSTSWTTGRNARNITLAANGVQATRLEVPLSGNTSELFSPMLGWGDTAVLGVLVDGLRDGENEIVVGSAGGEDGVVSWGADFVGVRIYW